MIWQHDAAGADANRFRAPCDITHHERCGCAGDAGHVVMLGQPVAKVAPRLGVPGEIERVVQRVGGGHPVCDRRKIKNRERYHRNLNVTRETDVATSAGRSLQASRSSGRRSDGSYGPPDSHERWILPSRGVAVARYLCQKGYQRIAYAGTL